MSACFHIDFPGGNGQCLHIDERADGVTVRFAAEVRNCPEALWFDFRLDGLTGRAVTVVLANPEQTLGGSDWSKNKLVVRVDGGSWQRTNAPTAERSDGGRREWAWRLPAGVSIEVAACYPYQQADLDETLAHCNGVFIREFIGVSRQGRSIERIGTTAAPGVNLPGVFLTARHHAGETPGAWVLDGLLRHVAATPALRDAITWWSVPFVNIDDVVEGSYGKDPWPHDCNRGYGLPWPYGNFARTESVAVAHDLNRFKSRCPRALVLDLHAPAHHERCVYVPISEHTLPPGATSLAPTDRADRIRRFAQLLHDHTPAPLRSPIALKEWGRPYSRHPGLSFVTYATHAHGLDAATVEYTYQGADTRDYTIDDYRALGATLAEAAANWLAT